MRITLVKRIAVVKPVLLLCLICFSAPVLVIGQTSTPAIVVAEFPRDGAITFVAIHPDGTTTDLGALPPEFRLSTYQTYTADDWDVRDPARIAISPNQQYAVVSANRRGTFQFFVYETSGRLLYAEPLTTPVFAHWSPDSRGFALTADTSSYAGGQFGIAYVDLDTGHIEQLVSSEQATYPRQLKWLDESTLAFLTVAPEGYSLNLLTHGEEPRELFAARTSPDQSTWGTICEYEWLEAQRIFLVATGCTGSPESIVFEELHTVDLAGSAHLILSAPEIYRRPNVFQARFSVVGVEVAAGNIYVLLYEYRNTDVGDEHPEFEEFRQWRLLRWQHGDWTEITSLVADQEFFTYANPSLSPDGRYLEVGYYQGLGETAPPTALVIIDVVSGTVIRRTEFSNRYAPNVTWFNHYQFLAATSYYGENDPMMSDFALTVNLLRLPLAGTIVPLNGVIWLPPEH